jgi:rhodanese-related sulfurtransferase
MMDMPDAFQLVDVRPVEHFADYNVPGSENVDLADILDNPSFLTGVGPLVIVDRDGSISMMVAGILSQKTPRNVKALYGGVQAYWNESDVGSSAQPMASPISTGPSSSGPSSASPRPRMPVPSTSVTPPPTAKPKRKSAGC